MQILLNIRRLSFSGSGEGFETTKSVSATVKQAPRDASALPSLETRDTGKVKPVFLSSVILLGLGVGTSLLNF